MDTPWIKFATPDTNREYFALLSYMPLNKYRAIPAFLKFSLQIQKQLRTTPGVMGYSLRAKLFSRNLCAIAFGSEVDRKSTRLNSSHITISYAVFCLKKKNIQ